MLRLQFGKKTGGSVETVSCFLMMGKMQKHGVKTGNKDMNLEEIDTV